MRRLKAKEMYMCRVICLDPPSLGRFAGRSDRPNSAALRHNFSNLSRPYRPPVPNKTHTQFFFFPEWFLLTCLRTSRPSLPTYRVT
jgi:hypothetical protein